MAKATAEETQTAEAVKFDPRTIRSIYDIVQDLSKEIPDRMLSHRKQGGTELTYISWHNATKLLDHYANGWRYENREVMNVAGKIVVNCRIIIPCIEGEVYRDATGNEAENNDSYGDPFSNSESMALRRAAAKFGLGRYLYDKGNTSQQSNFSGGSNRSGGGGNQNASTGNYPPTNGQTGGGNRAGKPTEKQLGYLAKLCNDRNISEIDVAQEYSDGRVEVFDQLTFDEIKAAIDAVLNGK